MNTPKPGIYRHYKGNFYQLLCTATHSETMEPMVVYRALYGQRGIWVRPASMWDETVEIGGKTVKRFEFLAEKVEELDEGVREEIVRRESIARI